MSTVRPLASFLTVMRFSNEARSWAPASEINTKNMIRILSARCFIGPPLGLDQSQWEEFDVTWGEGKLSMQRISWKTGGGLPHRGTPASKHRTPRAPQKLVIDRV